MDWGIGATLLSKANVNVQFVVVAIVIAIVNVDFVNVVHRIFFGVFKRVIAEH